MTKLRAKTCTPQFLQTFKEKFDSEYYQLYKERDCQAIEKLFQSPAVFESNRVFFDYTPLIVKGNENFGVRNAKNIYTMLKNLTLTQASKEEFWFTMLNTYYLDYVFESMEANDKPEFLKNMMFMGTTRAFFSQRLARSWWIGYRTYDENHQSNPWWLLDFMGASDIHGKAYSLFSSTFTNNKKIGLGIIEGVMLSQEHYKNVLYTYAYVDKYFNALGGVKILDVLTREQVRDMTVKLLADVWAGEYPINAKDREHILLEPKSHR